MKTVKLPKQWKHWCRKMNLRPALNRNSYIENGDAVWNLFGRGRSKYLWLYLKGHGYNWLIDADMNGVVSIQIGSGDGNYSPLPSRPITARTFLEFQECILILHTNEATARIAAKEILTKGENDV